MTIYKLFYKDDFETTLYFDNYNDADKNYEEAVADEETKVARLISCEFINGILTPVGRIKSYTKKERTV